MARGVRRNEMEAERRIAFEPGDQLRPCDATVDAVMDVAVERGHPQLLFVRDMYAHDVLGRRDVVVHPRQAAVGALGDVAEVADNPADAVVDEADVPLHIRAALRIEDRRDGPRDSTVSRPQDGVRRSCRTAVTGVHAAGGTGSGRSDQRG